MLSEADIVKLIFGLKVQLLRRENDLSYQQMKERTGMALSYLHNIEKGKKYPKAEKILALAKALDTDYNYLVSLEADRKLQPIIDLLQSDFLKIFPLESFGVNPPKLIELLSHTPDKINAFVSTVVKIIRNYHLGGEDFYQAALRSYQDLNENYFGKIEKEVRQFKAQNKLEVEVNWSSRKLEKLLKKKYGIEIDRTALPQSPALHEVRSYYSPGKRTLYITDKLSSAQENFLLAKELAFQFLDMEDRPYETRMVDIDSFEKLVNNFRASYFSVALLLDEQAMINEINNMSTWIKWEPHSFLSLLDKYNVTAEMLIQRLANVLPQHFGIKDLFFLRFITEPEMQKFEMTKEMHLSRLHDPHANQLDEHYCRRWISISLIRELKARQSIGQQDNPIVGAQVSNYWGTSNSYFCISLAKPDFENASHSNSITIGLLVNEKLRSLFPFLNDPKIKSKDVHTTCERCPIVDCGARAAAPLALRRAREREAVKRELEVLSKGFS